MPNSSSLSDYLAVSDFEQISMVTLFSEMHSAPTSTYQLGLKFRQINCFQILKKIMPSDEVSVTIQTQRRRYSARLDCGIGLINITFPLETKPTCRLFPNKVASF